MIDIESAVYTTVTTALREQFPGINIEGVATYSPAKFPTVCIEESDNYADRNTANTASNENYAVVVYEVNAYSNKSSGKKGECKAIISAVDEVMDGLGFTRNTKVPFGDVSVYRIFARYTAIVSKNKTIYRR